MHFHFFFNLIAFISVPRMAKFAALAIAFDFFRGATIDENFAFIHLKIPSLMYIFTYYARISFVVVIINFYFFFKFKYTYFSTLTRNTKW